MNKNLDIINFAVSMIIIPSHIFTGTLRSLFTPNSLASEPMRMLQNDVRIIISATKYVLEWMGHSSSAILDMYFTMNDRHAQAAMNSLSFEAEKAESRTVLRQSGAHFRKALPQPIHS